MLLNNRWLTEEIKEKIKNTWRQMKAKNMMIQNLCNAFLPAGSFPSIFPLPGAYSVLPRCRDEGSSLTLLSDRISSPSLRPSALLLSLSPLSLQ